MTREIENGHQAARSHERGSKKQEALSYGWRKHADAFPLHPDSSLTGPSHSPL